MPIYEFECSNGHRMEKIFSVEECPNNILCEYCPRVPNIISRGIVPSMAEKIWSRPANIQLGKPTRIFVNPKSGDTMVAVSDYDKPPKGYLEKELKGPVERSKFEKEEQRKLDVTNQIVSHQLEAKREATKRNRHADIKAHLSSLAAESDNPSGAETLIKSAMARKRPKRNPRRSEVKLAVNHTNASNLNDPK